MSDTSIGYIYISTLNDRYDRMRQNSIRSLRRVDPDVVCCTVPSLTAGYASRELRLKLPQYTPFDVTACIDADTVFLERFDLTALLGSGLFAAAPDPYADLRTAAAVEWPPEHVSVKEIRHTLAICGADYPFLNGGVLIFRQCEKARELFHVWHEEWQTYRQCDQFALARALVLTATKPVILPPRYNEYVSDGSVPDGAAALLHFIEGDKEHLIHKCAQWIPTI